LRAQREADADVARAFASIDDSWHTPRDPDAADGARHHDGRRW
jgi:hypothetical protein